MPPLAPKPSQTPEYNLEEAESVELIPGAGDKIRLHIKSSEMTVEFGITREQADKLVELLGRPDDE
jgi:hypothetical protein